jgi:P27 family predicted phage terminase small subunit
VPTHLKLIRGNPGKRKINKTEPQPLGALLDPPAHFDDEVKAVWNYAIQHAPRGLLRMLDSSVLETWCCAHVMHRRAVTEVRKYGMIVKAPNTGVPVQSPFLPIVNKQALIMMRAIDHLGFSPASRTRIALGEAPGDAMGDWGAIASSS